MFLCLQWLWDVFACWLRVFLAFLFPSISRSSFEHGKTKTDGKSFHRSQPKPDWVRTETRGCLRKNFISQTNNSMSF